MRNLSRHCGIPSSHTARPIPAISYVNRGKRMIYERLLESGQPLFGTDMINRTMCEAIFAAGTHA